MAKVLGKGLGALIKSYNKDLQSSMQDQLPIKTIVANKHQPRQSFHNKDMDDLIMSIRNKGIIQPLTVRQIGENLFELVAGERRLRAATKLGLKSVPVHVLQIEDDAEMMEMALIENIQRVNLNPIEEAEAFAVLRDKYNFSQLQIAETISKSRSEVANKLRLLQLPKKIKDSLKNGKIQYGHARTILSINSTTKILKIFNLIIKSNLNVRQCEQLVSQYKMQKKEIKKSASNLSKESKNINENLPQHLKVTFKNHGTGILKINFKSRNELNELLTILLKHD